MPNGNIIKATAETGARLFFRQLREQRGMFQRRAMQLRREGGDPRLIEQLDATQLRLKQIYYEHGGERYDPTIYW